MAPDVAIRRLVDEGVLSDAQGTAVLGALAGSQPEARTGWVAEVSGYLGGGVMAGGMLWVLGSSWDQLNRPGRAGILGAISVALIIAAVVAAGNIAALRTAPTSARRRVVGVLLASAALPILPAVWVLVGTNDHGAVAGSTAALVLAAIAYALVPNPYAVVVMAGASVWASLTASEEISDVSQQTKFGVALLITGVVWGAATLAPVIRPAALGLSIAAAFAIIGGQVMLSADHGSWLGYLTTAVIGGLCLAVYPRVKQTVLIVAAVIAVTLAIPEALYDWSDGRLQVAYVVLIGGAVLVGASVGALRWKRETV